MSADGGLTGWKKKDLTDVTFVYQDGQQIGAQGVVLGGDGSSSFKSLWKYSKTGFVVQR